jgi:FKBP-type peptidyl-prolyl cis-trans isomerase FkpA
MRKFSLLILACTVLCFSNISCLKSSTPTVFTCNTVDQDAPAILSYLQANQITGYTKDASGLYYKIEAQGSGPVPTLSSKAFVTYSGRFTDHTLFDTLADASKSGWVLGTLIKGWQIGLPLIQKGGKISLFVPNQLGYGCGNTGGIPGGSILIFDVTLVDVQ